MRPTTPLAHATTPDGTPMILYERAGVYTLRVDGRELMSSRAHRSEEALARLSCESVAERERPRVLVAGLGFGYTLRSALDHLPADAAVTVCEVFECVLEWNRELLGGLAGHPLADRRVRAVHADVRACLAHADPFDAILLDVDNGPEALARRSNKRLYDRSGVVRLRAALTPGGVLGVWSSTPSPAFERRLAAADLDVTSLEVPARSGGNGPSHYLFLARRRESSDQ